MILGSRGRAAWALITLAPDSMAPVACALATPTVADEGAAIAFEGVAYANRSVTYQWDLGNGETRLGQSLNYAFPDNGSFPVTLTVTTPGGTSTDLVTVTIANVAPSAAAGADLTVDEGAPAAFIGGLSDPGSADTHLVGWDFGHRCECLLGDFLEAARG